MARPIWQGSISFGLVDIPVLLYPAEAKKELSFRMLDKRDLAPLKEERVNERTGKPVPWEDVVKGYKYDDRYIVLTDGDFRKANVKATQALEILAFVKEAEIEPIYFNKPYYLQPAENALKPYLLLRDTLRSTGQVGIGKVVIRTREHLTAVMPKDPCWLSFCCVLHMNYVIRLLQVFPLKKQRRYMSRRTNGRWLGN